MTALAAGLALVPIALSAGEPGSEIQAPMAMVIMFGLLSSTALNMIVVPICTNSSVDRWRDCLSHRRPTVPVQKRTAPTRPERICSILCGVDICVDSRERPNSGRNVCL